MPSQESLQHKLDRVRAPRVQITYDVEIGDSIQMKEIPFVTGVLADLSGKPDKPLPKLKERKFIEIDRDNFNSVLGATNPRLAFKVDNKLTGEESKLGVELRFKSLDDFHPEQVVKQIEPLNKLIQARKKLSDLLSKLDGNDRLDELLQEVVSNTDMLKEAGDEAGAEKQEEEKSKE